MQKVKEDREKKYRTILDGLPSPRFVCRRRNILRAVKWIYGQRTSIDVLDVGCGGGLLMSSLEKKGCRVDGFDIDALLVERARSHVRGQVFIGDILTFDSKKSYDLVICSEVLEHIEDHLRAAKKLANFMRPGGHLIITVPNNSKLWNSDDELAGHLRRYEFKMLEELMNGAGFNTLKVNYFGYPFVNLFALFQHLYFIYIKRQQANTPSHLSRTAKFVLRLFFLIERIDDLFNSPRAGSILVIYNKVCSATGGNNG